MESARIERQYQDAKELYNYLMKSEEVSFASYIEGVYKKVLLLSAANFFEYEITSLIKKFAQKASKSDMRLVTLVEKKALARQYHNAEFTLLRSKIPMAVIRALAELVKQAEKKN